MESFTTMALFVSALYAAQNLLRYLKARDWNGTVGIVIAVLAGFGVVALAAHSGVTESLSLIKDGPVLGSLDLGSQLLLGIAVGSAGTVLADGVKSLDNTQSAAKPKIVGE